VPASESRRFAARCRRPAPPRQATPVGLWGGESEIAKAIVLLCQYGFHHGETIRVDGGRHLE